MLPFVKYQGIGNDFLVVDFRREPVPAALERSAAWLCDRRFGVGGDGVLVVLPSKAPGADCRMRVLNADGSEAEMCGNGIRCVARHLHDTDASLRRPTLHIETLAGVLACGVSDAGVSVAMGRPRFLRREIPMTGDAEARCVEVPLAGDPSFPVTAVSIGNPHAVTFVDETGPALRALAERHGPALEHHPWFPRRTNVEFAHVTPAGIELVVWERGCGITLACGTGACATAAAACLTGRAALGDTLTVRLLGGELGIVVAPDYSGVTMTGPATRVFDGSVALPE